MTPEDIDKLTEEGEGRKLEFKEAYASIPKSVYETVASFSNTDGGTILFGVKDDGSVTGVDRNAVNKLQKDLVTAINTPECIYPPMYFQPLLVNHPEGLLLILQVPSSSQVHNHAGRTFIREHDSDLDITDQPQRISNLHLKKRNFFSEAQVYPYLTIDDLEPVLLEKARQLIRNYRSDHPWLLVSDEQLLRESSLWRRDFTTGEEGLTLAAALIFGKDTTIQSLLPAYKVEAMTRIQNADRWDDRLTLRTNLIDTYLALKQFVNRYLPEKFYLEADQRIDLRDKIFREVIGNVIVHREYTSALSTDMIISDNEVNITNPNKALFHGPLDPQSFNPYPKNPNIRKFFTAFGWTDEIGSGIRNTYKYLPLYVSGAKPLFWEDDTFRTRIPLQVTSLGTYIDQLQIWMEFPASHRAHLQKGLSSILLPPFLNGITWQDLVLYLVPTWHRNGTNLKDLDWPLKQVYEPNKIKKVPSWDQKGTNLLHKKAHYLVAILLLSSIPIKLDELMEILAYKNRATFRNNYLLPLLQTELISRTNPENLNDPEQRYRLTEKGKQFLTEVLPK